jgi:hypothetical protein
MDIDVELKILQETRDLKNVGIIITFEFDIGHQQITEQSSTQHVFNQKADELATSQLNRENSCLPFDVFPTMKAYVVFKQQIILGNLKNVIREIRHYPALYELIKNRSENKVHSIPTLWWPIITKTMNMFQVNDRMRTNKYNFKELHTKQREHKFDDTISPICICCNSEVESNHHIIICNTRITIIQTMLDSLLKTISKIIHNQVLGEIF